MCKSYVAWLPLIAFMPLRSTRQVLLNHSSITVGIASFTKFSKIFILLATRYAGTKHPFESNSLSLRPNSRNCHHTSKSIWIARCSPYCSYLLSLLPSRAPPPMTIWDKLVCDDNQSDLTNFNITNDHLSFPNHWNNQPIRINHIRLVN